MLDGTSTGADSPVVCGALRYLTYSVTVTLVFQKRYFVGDLRLQIVYNQLLATLPVALGGRFRSAEIKAASRVKSLYFSFAFGRS